MGKSRKMPQGFIHPGYMNNFSMSINAASAYKSGEKPMSKWDKKTIMAEVIKIDAEKADLLQPVSAQILKNKLLVWTSWHHTSKRFNRTDFYSLDKETVLSVTKEDIRSWTDENRMRRAEKPISIDAAQYRGDFHYIEWTGTIRHPRPINHVLESVLIEERGCFYYITDDSGKLLLKKKIGSNGTEAIRR